MARLGRATPLRMPGSVGNGLVGVKPLVCETAKLDEKFCNRAGSHVDLFEVPCACSGGIPAPIMRAVGRRDRPEQQGRGGAEYRALPAS
jgi:hypothetical protein